MTGKNKGEWPYHEDPHGNWVACSSNPCKLHSGGDIMATSPEDAYAKAHADDNAGGMTSAAATHEGNRKPIYGTALKEHRKAMDRKVGDLITPPAANIHESGTEFFEGGKYDETRHMKDEEVADLIRSDIQNLKKAGAVPSDWDVSVEESGASKFRIFMNADKSRKKPLRHISYEDITNDEKNGGDPYLRKAYLDETHDDSYSEAGAKEYCRKNSVLTEATPELQDAERYISAAAGQYSSRIRNSEQNFEMNRRTFEIDMKEFRA